MVPGFTATVTHDPNSLWVPPIEAGTFFLAKWMLSDGTYLITSPDFSQDYGINIDRDGRVIGGLFLLSHRRVSKEPGSWPKDPLFDYVEPMDTPNVGAFRAQIVYSGLSGNVLQAVYREFVGDFIRPAFTQDLQYTLQDSVLSFRSLRVRILQATNTQLDYVVQEDGGLPWLP